MDFFPIFTYFFFLCLALATIYFSIYLAKKFKLKFLHYYQYFIILSYIYMFINFTGKMLISEVFTKSSYTIESTGLIISSVVAPAMSISLYMLIYWVRELLSKKVPTILKIGYWLVQLLLYLIFFMGIKTYFDSKDLKSSAKFFSTVEIISLAIVSLALLHLLIESRSLQDKTKQKMARTLGIIHLAGLAIFLCSVYIRLPFYRSDFIVLSFLSFLDSITNIIPLSYLWWFLKKHHGEMISPSFKDINIDRFLSEYNISPREQSIISLIVKGKTSQEIGKELFISVKTVKNHISSVYQKTGMKNRVQLSNLIRSFQD